MAANSIEEISIDETGCRARQAKLVEAMHRLEVDLVVLTRGESINWLTGVFLGPLFEPVAAIDLDGHVTLVLPERKLSMPAIADQVVGYQAKRHSTMRNDQRQASMAALVDAIGQAPAAPAGEFSCFANYLTEAWPASWNDIDPTLLKLRRHKYPDELALLARANEANRKMYERAREIVVPGINELDLYSELHRVAIDTLGEPLTYFGQDFQCSSRGGPPRNRQAKAGELYILDLGVGFRGYHSDNARTIAVGGKPTNDQQAAWQAVTKVFRTIENVVCPGVSCKALFEGVQEQLDESMPWIFNHHLGHGVGLSPHEGPHLNPHWNDTFAEGDFFTAEPGLYHETLRHGLRLEQNYVVTETGVELLTDWGLEL